MEPHGPGESASRLSVLEVLKASAGYLEGKGLEQPRYTAEHLLARALACKRLDLYLRFDAVPGPAQLDRVRAGLRRCAAGEPLQYVLGDVEFMGHTIKVDRRVLIPRPETEEVVAHAIRAAAGLGPRLAVADVGTGSGCVAVSLAAALPGAFVAASDIDAGALEVAAANVAASGMGGRIGLRRDDLLGAVAPGLLDLVVANLPYIPSAECDRLDPSVRSYEPRIALDGGEDGLELIGRLAGQARRALRPGGVLVLEIGHNQGEAAAAAIAAAGFAAIGVEPDMAGRQRIVRGAVPAA